MIEREIVLVVDDEANLREMICQLLSKKFEVITAANGKQALEIARVHKPQVILLDIIMPEMDGTSVCQQLRNDPNTKASHIIMLTALNDSKQRTASFSAGADDYIEKPFRPEELMARVESKMRRARDSVVTAAERSVGNVVIDYAQMSVRIKGKENIKLGVIEFKILNVLAASLGALVPRNVLVDRVWGNEADKRMLDPHMTSLRKKIAKSNLEIKTVYGEGYSLIVSA